MLSLGPGSACDVCLEPFGAELKAPCSIPCGHVFCVSCLQNVPRPTCPLCRTPFEARTTIKLHIDLDNIRAPSSTDETMVDGSPDDIARHLQKKITSVAVDGATEAQTTQLTEECKAFLTREDVQQNIAMYSDLRTAYKMLYYMCHVKHLYRDQRSAANQLTRNVSALSQEVDRLKAAIEVLRIQKRDLEQAWQTVSAERDDVSLECHRLHEQLDNQEAQMLLITEQNETAQNQLVLLNEELQRLRSEVEFSSPDGDSPADLLDFPSELPPSTSPDLHWPHTTPGLDFDFDNQDPAAPFLTPWEGFTERKTLPDADLPEDPQPAATQCRPNGAYCGAAGCPHSCDCMPFVLFSPGSREAAAANAGRSSPPAISTLFAPAGAPSALSLSLNQDRARSRSRSRPRSRSLSRAPSPVSSHLPSASPLPSMSSSLNIPNPHHELRGQLQDLLRDPPMSSSLPNMAPSHFPSSPLSREFLYGASSPLYATSSRDRSAPIAPTSRPRDGYLHPPVVNYSNTPSPLHTSSTLSDPSNSQRPALHRMASSTSQAVDETQRSDKERRRSERAARASPTIAGEERPTPMLRPQTHSSSPIPPSLSTQASSPAHPMSRPQLRHVPSLRLPSPSLSSSADGTPRPQAHSGPLTSPVPNPSDAPQPQSSMPRAQAHAYASSLPSPTTPPNSAPRPSTRPLQPRPAVYTNPAAPSAPSASVGLNSSAIYGAPASRHTPQDAYGSSGTSSSAQRMRRPEATADTRGGHAGATRGTSKRMHAPAMGTNFTSAVSA